MEFQILALPEEDAPAPAWFSVNGLVSGSLGIFQSQTAPPVWSITHLPSGRRVVAAGSEEAARRIIEHLLGVDFPWHKAEFSAAESALMIRFINQILLPKFAANGWLPRPPAQASWS